MKEERQRHRGCDGKERRKGKARPGEFTRHPGPKDTAWNESGICLTVQIQGQRNQGQRQRRSHRLGEERV